MSMHFRDIAERAVADGAISAEEILTLRQAGWADGIMDPEEAESLFIANDHLTDPSADWIAFFVEALSNFVVNTVAPVGYVDEEMAEELIARIDHDGQIRTRSELELLVRVFEKATSVPASLKDYALRQIENAVTSGEGPSREGLEAGEGITADEAAMLRRFIFAPASDRPAAVSRAEAEMLFRIKDATLYEVNAPEWGRLFVQGVANFLLGFGGNDPLPAGRIRELETFMSEEGAGIGNFLVRMMNSNPRDGFGSLLSMTQGNPLTNEDGEHAAEFSEEEQNWLQNRLEADEDLDELEKALLSFIAEETGELFGLAA